MGTAEGERASVRIWPNAGDEISVWLEEDYRKEGKPDVFSIEALCSLPKPVALALGKRLIELAGA